MVRKREFALDAEPTALASDPGVTPTLFEPDDDPALLRRRQFLRGGFWAGIGVLLAGGAAVTADFLAPRVTQRFGAIITVEAADVPRPGGEPYYVKEGKFWLVNLKPGEGGVPLFTNFSPANGLGAASRNGGLLALYEKCTHLGWDVPVPWRPNFNLDSVTGWFRCPSHGATYTRGGLRVLGPVPRSMDTFRIVQVSRTGVTVNTGAILLGSPDDAQRTVPAGPFA